jgi:hypothetical protein
VCEASTANGQDWWVPWEFLVARAGKKEVFFSSGGRNQLIIFTSWGWKGGRRLSLEGPAHGFVQCHPLLSPENALQLAPGDSLRGQKGFSGGATAVSIDPWRLEFLSCSDWFTAPVPLPCPTLADDLSTVVDTALRQFVRIQITLLLEYHRTYQLHGMHSAAV